MDKLGGLFKEMIAGQTDGGPGAEETKGGKTKTGTAGGGGGFFGGMNLGGFGAKESRDKAKYKSALKHGQDFQGKGVIMTGGTGGIGSQILKQIRKCETANR